MARGATTHVDGISWHPSYSYTPPAVFFDGGTPAVGQGVFNILDYGAVAEPAVDNRAAIQAAIDAAHDAGGGLVYVPHGVYGVDANPDKAGAIYLEDNVFMMGDGMGQSVLRVVDNASGDITGIVRTDREETDNYGLADITLDGNRDNNANTLKVVGYYSGGIPNETISDHDAWVLRVEARNNNGYGFDPHEQTHRLTIADSVADHNHKDGFVADFIVDGVYRNNLAYENDRHGFNITTTTNNFLLLDNIAHDNGLGTTGGAGITLQRGDFDIPFPHNIEIRGGEVYGNSKEGIQIRMTDNVLVTGVSIHDNGTYGVRLKGASHVSLLDDSISGNSASLYDQYSSIVLGAEQDSITGKTFDSDYNLFKANVITGGPDAGARYGFEEKAGESDLNLYVDNLIGEHVRGLTKLGSLGSIWVEHGDGTDNVLDGVQIRSILYGRGGNDILTGGDDNDLLFGGAGADTIDGGNGMDAIGYAASKAAVLIDLANHLASGGQATGDVFSNVEAVNGSAFADTLRGDTASNWLRGLDGDDHLFGRAGPDFFVGGSGGDTMGGGWGHDTAVYRGSAAAVSVDLRAGTASGGDAAGDKLFSIENLTGSSHDDTLTGNGAGNRLVGQKGDDVLHGCGGGDYLLGGGGSDVLVGGAGGDTLRGGWGHDTAVYRGSAAAVSVDLTAGTASGGQAAGDIFFSIENLTGSSHDDTLTGNAADNWLVGGKGDDILHGRGGDDHLIGGPGADWMSGGAGADRFVFAPGHGADTIADFNPSLDTLGLEAYHFATVQDVVVLAVQDGANAVIDFGGDAVVTLINVDVHTLGSDNILV